MLLYLFGCMFVYSVSFFVVVHDELILHMNSVIYLLLQDCKYIKPLANIIQDTKEGAAAICFLLNN